MPNTTEPGSETWWGLVWCALYVGVTFGGAGLGFAHEQPATALRAAVVPMTVRPHAAVSRPCGPIDVLGTWDLIAYGTSRAPLRTDAPYLYPYQVFQFAKDGTLKSAHSLRAFIGGRETVLEALPDELRYQMSPAQPGWVLVMRNGREEAAETWYCRRMTLDQVDVPHRRVLRQGDVILILVDRTGAPFFTRSLRRA